MVRRAHHNPEERQDASERRFTMHFDELVRERIDTHADEIIISYPSVEDDSLYHELTWTRLERLTRAAAIKYADLIAGSKESGEGGLTIGLIGVSSLEHNLSFGALQRLGHTVMLISPRLADEGVLHLLRREGAHHVIASGPSLDQMKRIVAALEVSDSLMVIRMLTMPVLLDLEQQIAAGSKRFELAALSTDTATALVLHTGGTTGLPKPVRITTESITVFDIPATDSKDMDSSCSPDHKAKSTITLSTLPLFHAFGMGQFLGRLWRNEHIVLTGAHRPVTVESMRRAMDSKNVSRLATVPYVLKFWAEEAGGLDRLAKLEMIMWGGSALPQALGDQLLAAGVQMQTGYGQTESGLCMALSPRGKDWNWLAPLPHAKPHLRFEPIGDGVYHLVIRAGHPTLVLSDRPDGSYGTKDLFVAHATEPDLWRFVARLDDIIVLVNGEKADPHPLETYVSANPLVQVAVVFGSGRDALGMIVIPSEKARLLAREEFVDRIMPSLQQGNSKMPSYACVGREGLVVKDIGTPIPMTAKCTLIRPLFLKQFDDDIKRHYAEKEQAVTASIAAQDTASDEQVRAAVREIVLKELGASEELDDDADFFAAGMDSLQATNVRAGILQRVFMRDKPLATNVVFNHPTIAAMANHLINVRDGRNVVGDAQRAAETLAVQLVHKYSNFTVQPCHPSSHVLLTGATGFIGRQILFALLRSPSVARVVCLVRAPSDAMAHERVLDALEDCLVLPELSHIQRAKISALASDLSDPLLGLTQLEHVRLRDQITHVVHNAWAVNFNMGLGSFESGGISATAHLLAFCDAPREPKASFTFVSSISSIARAQDSLVAEKRYPFSAVGPMGYGQSKWVAEELCYRAATTRAIHCNVIRVGQVCGDRKSGRWNVREAIPRLVQSALVLGVLPRFEKQDLQFWQPADIAGASIASIALADQASAPTVEYFHVAHTVPLSWSNDFLPALKKRGVLTFETVSAKEWLARLEQSNPDVTKNPSRKLLEYFRLRLGGPSATDGEEKKDPLVDTMPELQLDVTRAKKVAPSMRQMVKLDEELIGRYLDYWMVIWKEQETKSANLVAANQVSESSRPT